MLHYVHQLVASGSVFVSCCCWTGGQSVRQIFILLSKKKKEELAEKLADESETKEQSRGLHSQSIGSE